MRASRARRPASPARGPRPAASRVRCYISRRFSHLIFPDGRPEHDNDATPRPTAQHHLGRFARQLFDFYADHPHAIRAIAMGQIVISSRSPPILETLVGQGVRAGFTSGQSFEIWMFVMAAVIGAASLEAGDRKLNAEGRWFISDIVHTQRERGGETPHLDALLETPAHRLDHFDMIRIMIESLRVRYGERLWRTEAFVGGNP